MKIYHARDAMLTATNHNNFSNSTHIYLFFEYIIVYFMNQRISVAMIFVLSSDIPQIIFHLISYGLMKKKQ